MDGRGRVPEPPELRAPYRDVEPVARRERDEGPELTEAGFAVLRDGTPVLVRPLLPADRESLVAGFAAMSPESRYSRFLTAVRTLTPAMQRRLVDTVDGVRHVALALLVLPPAVEAPVLAGVGRFVRYASDPATAEVAVTIGDPLQGRGAGTLLLRQLAVRARELGVTTFTGTVASSNLASQRMLAAAGAVRRLEDVGNGVAEIIVDLGAVVR